MNLLTSLAIVQKWFSWAPILFLINDENKAIRALESGLIMFDLL